MLHLLINFLIRTNLHLQITPNNKVETELQTFKLHKSRVRKCFRLEARVIYDIYKLNLIPAVIGKYDKPSKLWTNLPSITRFKLLINSISTPSPKLT